MNKQTYKGYDVSLSGDMRFLVNFKQGIDTYERDEKHFSSYYEAIAAIDTHLKSLAKIKAKAQKTKLGAYTGNGRRVTISGIHAGNGSITFNKSGRYERHKARDEYTQYREEDLYPIADWIADALRERLELEKRQNALTAALNLVEIELSSHYGRNFSVEERTDQLIRVFDESTKLAGKFKTVAEAVSEAKRKEKNENERGSCK